MPFCRGRPNAPDVTFECVLPADRQHPGCSPNGREPFGELPSRSPLHERVAAVRIAQPHRDAVCQMPLLPMPASPVSADRTRRAGRPDAERRRTRRRLLRARDRTAIPPRTIHAPTASRPSSQADEYRYGERFMRKILPQPSVTALHRPVPIASQHSLIRCNNWPQRPRPNGSYNGGAFWARQLPVWRAGWGGYGEPVARCQ
jgi:hypothetical protein